MTTDQPTDQYSGGAPPEEAAPPEIPRGQKFFDNIWLLLILSLAISLIVYNLWGLIDLAFVPPAP